MKALTLLLRNRPVATIHVEWADPKAWLCSSVQVQTQDPDLKEVLEEMIFKNSRGIAILGGIAPDDLSQFFDGIAKSLLDFAEEFPGYTVKVSAEIPKPEFNEDKVTY